MMNAHLKMPIIQHQRDTCDCINRQSLSNPTKFCRSMEIPCQMANSATGLKSHKVAKITWPAEI